MAKEDARIVYSPEWSSTREAAYIRAMGLAKEHQLPVEFTFNKDRLIVRPEYKIKGIIDDQERD